MSTIESTSQLDNLPVDSTVTISHVGSAPQRWRKIEDQQWTLVTADGTDSLPIGAKFFRGAVEAGKVRIANGGEEDFDPTRWQIGDWWYTINDQTTAAWLVTSEDRSGNIHNLLMVSSSRAQRAVWTQRDMERNSTNYVRYPDDTTLPECASWFRNEVIAPTKASVKPTLPTGLEAALRQYAEQNDDNGLVDILQEGGVDMSVTTRCYVEGMSVVTAQALAGMLGAGVDLTEDGLEVEWNRSFEVKVRRGCICGTDWQDAVISGADVLNQIPASRTALSVELTCQMHD